jgi:hypothetical protein
MRTILTIVLSLLMIQTAFGQDRKLRKVKELIVENKNAEADDIIIELIAKYPTSPIVLYYSSVVDLKLNRSLDSIYQNMQFGSKNLVNLRYENNISDSTELGFTKEEFQRFKLQVRDLAFDKYYKDAKTIDSLHLFIAKFDLSNIQRSYIENRICEITSIIALSSVDLSVLRDFINNNKNCVQIKLVESRLLLLNWQSAKKFNTYKSYEMFEQQNPNSIFSDSIKSALELLDWERAQFYDSITSYEFFMSKYPNSQFKKIAINKIDTLIWRPISTSGTLRELQDFVNRYPQSQYIKQANDSIVKLEWFAIAITGDISSVENFLKKFPNSYYDGQASKRFDELLWKSTNVASVESLEDYLKDCKICVFKENALEKLSLIEWDKIKLTQDTMLLNDFLHHFPKSTKVDKASQRKAELLAEIDFQVARKVHGFAPCDSFETEDYWIEKHGGGVVKKYTKTNSNKVIKIFGKYYSSSSDWEYAWDEFSYQGYSKIFNMHVISQQEIGADAYLIYVNDSGSQISEHDLLNNRIVPIQYRSSSNPSRFEFECLEEVVRDKKNLRFIARSAGSYVGFVGFAVLKGQLGESRLYQESEIFNFGQFNQEVYMVQFVNYNKIEFCAVAYTNVGNSVQSKMFNGFIIFNEKLNQWQVLKK